MVGTGRVAGRRTNATIAFGNPVIVAQLLFRRVAPVLEPHPLVQVFRQCFGEPVRQRFQDNCAVVVVRLLETTRRGPVRGHRPVTPSRKAGDVLRGITARAGALGLRRAAQLTLFALAAVVVIDGWFGPQHPSALNLAGVLPWTYWRGFAVIALLVAGNLFCAVCPFTLSRSLAARLLGRPFTWPAALRNKWLGVALFAVYLWSYETFALWDSPYWTAWVIVGYNIYQSLYRTLTDFDLRIQEPRLTIGGRVGRVFPTFTYAYQNQTLGSDGFLSSHLLDFDLDIALTDRWFLFLGGEVERITYDFTPARTGYRGAINLGPQIRFLDNLVSLRVIWEPTWQRTDGATFSFNGQSVLTELNVFIPRGRGLDMDASYQYIQNDYTERVSGFGLGYRHDTYHVLRLGLQMPLAKYANISADYLHLRSESTIPDLNYSQNILTFRIGFWYF